MRHASMLFLLAACAVGCGKEHTLADAASDTATVSDASACVIAACDPNAACVENGGSASCVCKPGYEGDGKTCTAVAVALNGLRWEIPCGTDADAVTCNVTDPATQTATLTGAAGTTYTVSLRFRGVVEQKTYTGGTADSAAGGYFYTGGAENGDGYNVYQLSISSPAQTFFLNAGASGITNCWPIDYTETMPIAAGATITLSATAKDGLEIKNRDAATGAPIVVPDVPPAPNAYAGQFIQIDVLNVDAP